MEPLSEVDRLQAVYREYVARGFGQSKWSSANPGNQALTGECQRRLRAGLRAAGYLPLTNRRILDVGCGTGDRLAAMVDWGARAENVLGVDLLADRIQAARRNHPHIPFQLVNAECLPAADGAFDLVMVFTVFTSILDDEMAANVSREIVRVLAPGGAVLWYDFRLANPFNRHVRACSRRRVRRLFPGLRIHLHTLSLLPPLARRLGRLTHRLYRPLSSVPFLRSHYLGILIKP